MTDAMLPPMPTIAEVAATLDKHYAAHPDHVRIAPRWMRMIEACGGTFDFETGKVHIPPVETETVPVPAISVPEVAYA